MKKILVMAFAAMLLVLVGASAQATFWVPDDHNTNYPNYSFIQFNTIDGSEILGLFDDTASVSTGTHSDDYLPLLPNSSSASVTVAFAYDSSAGTWSASSGGNSIDLGASNVFQLGFWDGSKWMTDISYVGGDSVYSITFDTVGNYATQADANPVPIPAAAIMLFSGILGLFGVRRMRRDS